MNRTWLSAGIGIFVIIILLVFRNYSFENSIESENKEKINILEKKEIVLVQDHEEARVPILIYHNIREATSRDSSYDRQFIISPAEFEKHLNYLQENNFTTISLDNLFDFLEMGNPLPKNPIILTFDDGVRNQYQVAFPLLKQHNFIGTFFVFTNAMDKNDHYMTWAELKEMSDAGMTIGSHTRLHPYLNSGQAQVRLEGEIIGSKKDIEDNLGIEAKYFAYPFGEYDENVMSLVSQAGYRGARDILHGKLHHLKKRYALNAYFAPIQVTGLETLLQ